jgi:hypothetical protein
LASIQAALALAQQLAHPLSLTMALRWAAVVHYLRREALLTQARAEASMTIATEHGFEEQIALVTPLRDWALATTGEGEEGVVPSLRGLAAYQAAEATRDRSDGLALLAETFAQVGQIIAALTREHGGWEQACLRTTDARSRVQCLVPARGARRGKALDEVGATIPRDAVARNDKHQPRVLPRRLHALVRLGIQS